MYASQQDLAERLDPAHLVELADDDRDGAPDSAVLDAAILDADALIDAHLEARYAVPLAAPAGLVRRLSADLAAANLFARRRDAVSPLHERRAEDARDTLRALACGEILLPRPAAHGARPAADSTTRETAKRFDRSSLEPF